MSREVCFVLVPLIVDDYGKKARSPPHCLFLMHQHRTGQKRVAFTQHVIDHKFLDSFLKRCHVFLSIFSILYLLVPLKS